MTTAVLGILAALVGIGARARRLPLLSQLSGGLVAVGLTSLVLWGVQTFAPPGEVQGWAEAALTLALGYVAARGLIIVVVEWLLVQRVGIEVPRLGRDVIGLLVYLLMAAAVLRALLGIEVGALLATSAVVTVVIGLALQETLGTLLAGLALAWEKRLRTGEWIEVDGHLGRVEELGWRSVVLRGRFGERFLIPNSTAVKAHVRMLGRGERPGAVRVQLGVAYGVPPDRVLELLRQVAVETEGVVHRPAPQVQVTEFGDSAVHFEVRLWTLQPWRDYDLRGSFLCRAHAALARAGMEIPFPQRTVHMAPTPLPVDRSARCRQAISRCAMLADLGSDHQVALAASSRWLRFAPGELILRQGDPSDELYILDRGAAVVERSGRVIAQLGAGEIVGERALLTGEPRSADVRAETAVEAVEIGRVALGRVIEADRDLAQELAARMAAREASGGGDPSGANPILAEEGGLVAQIRAHLLRLVSGPATDRDD